MTRALGVPAWRLTAQHGAICTHEEGGAGVGAGGGGKDWMGEGEREGEGMGC